MKSIKKIFEYVVDFIFPRGDEEREIKNISYQEFIKVVPKATVFSGNKIEAFISYRHPLVKNLIRLLKYKKDDRAAELCAKIFLENFGEELSGLSLLSGNKKTLLIPIPPTKHRIKEYGFCQTDFLAETIIKNGGQEILQAQKDCLVKIKDTPSQVKTRGKQERLDNLKGSFGIKNPEIIRNRNIILIDDVTTTGATLCEAATTLRKAGAKKVIAVAIAH